MADSVLRIRQFEARDEEEVRRLWLEAFPNDPPRNEPSSVIRRKLGTQRELFLVGESNGVVVATLLGEHLEVAHGPRVRGNDTQ